MKLLQALVNETWGDDRWRTDLWRFINTVEAFEGDTDEVDIDVLKVMLKDHEGVKALSGEPLYKLMKILLSIKSMKTGVEFWEEKETLFNHIVQAALNAGDQGVVDLQKHVKIEDLSHLVSKDLYNALKLRASKVNRTPEEVKIDDEHDVYIFIGRDKYIEGKKGNFRKTLEIENLYKIDRFDLSDHQALRMLKLRANAQGDGSAVYKVLLPKDAIEDKKATGGSEIPDWLVSLIDDHKQRI